MTEQKENHQRYFRQIFGRYRLQYGRLEVERGGERLRIHCWILPLAFKSKELRRSERKKAERFFKKYEVLFSGEIWFERSLAEIWDWKQPALTAELLLYRLGREKNRAAVVLIEKEEAEWEDRSFYRELLELLYRNLNYLTIIGSNGEAYEELAEQIYGDSGLLIRCVEKPVKGYPFGEKPLILNFGERRRVRQDLFPEESFFLNVHGEMLKFLDTTVKNGYTDLVIGDYKNDGGL